MLSPLLALALLSFVVADDITSTTQVTVTPTLTTTVTDWVTVDVFETVYIYTNSLGLWTTTTATGYSTEAPSTTGSTDVVPLTTSATFQITSSTAPPTTTTSSIAASLSDLSSSSQASSSAISAAGFGLCSAYDSFGSYEDGFISTSYSTVTEEINGTPVVVEYTVLYTDVC